MTVLWPYGNPSQPYGRMRVHPGVAADIDNFTRHINSRCDPAPITEEIRMTTQPTEGFKPTTVAALPGVPSALDHLEHAQSELMETVRTLLGKLEPVLQPEESTPSVAMGVDVDGRPRSEVARVIEDQADRLASFTRYVHGVMVRIDV